MKTLISILICAAAAGFSTAQSGRPAKSYPLFFEAYNAKTNDDITTLFNIDNKKMTLHTAGTGTVGIDLAAEYAGGDTISFYLLTKQLPSDMATMEIQMYSFAEGEWVTISGATLRAKGTASDEIFVQVPAADYVDPDMGIVLTRVLWHLHRHTDSIWIDAATWFFGT